MSRSGHQLIRQDSFDSWEWARLLSGSPVLQELSASGEQQLDTYPEFLSDFWASLYKMSPELVDLYPSSHVANHTMLEAAMQLPEWDRLRAFTRLDAVSAAIGLEALTSRLEIPDLPDNPDDWEDWQGEVRRSLRHAAKDAHAEVEALAEATEWGSHLGSGNPVSPEERLALARKLQNSDRLKQIAELAGRFSRIAFSKFASRTTHGVDDVVDVDLGNDLSRVLPAELARLGDPHLTLDFQRRYLEGQLLQLRLEGSEPVGRGPLIVAVDESGSMSGERDLWAKGIALALLAVAARENREAAIIHFGCHDELRVDRFPRGQATAADALASAQHFYAGGTCFDRPLEEAVKLIREDTSLQQADVLFITDGECHLDIEPVLQAKSELGFRIWGVAIECDAPVLDSFCDAVAHVRPDTQGAMAVCDLVF